MKFQYILINNFLIVFWVFLLLVGSLAIELNLVISVDPSEPAIVKNGIFSGLNEFVNRSSSTITSVSTHIINPRDLDTNNDDYLCSKLSFSSKQLTIILEIETKTDNHLNDSTTNQLKLFARNMLIPMISIKSKCSPELEWANLNQWEAQYLINFQPPLTTLMRSIIDITNHLQINDGQIFYEKETAYYVPCFIREPSLRNFTFTLIELHDQVNYLQQSNQIIADSVKRKVTNYIAIGRSSFINNLIEAFRQNNLFKQPYKLIVISKDGDKIKCFSCKHGQLIVGQPLMSAASDYDEPAISTYFHPVKLLSKDVYEFYYYHDLIHLFLESIDSARATIDRLAYTANVTFASLSDTSSIKPLSCRTSRSAFDDQARLITVPFSDSLIELSSQNYGKLGPFKLIRVNSSDQQQTGYQEISVRLKKHSYYADYVKQESIGEWESNLPHGRVYFTARQAEDSDSNGPMKIALFQTPPFLTKRITNSTDEAVYEGFLIDLFDEIRKQLGDKFPDYVLEETSETSIGTMNMKQEDEDTEDSTIAYSGLIKQIIEDKTYEMALAPAEITEDRAIGIDFSEPFFDLIGFSILMKKPIKESHVWKFVTVLEGEVWLCITASYLFTSLLLSIFDRYSPYSYRNRPEKFETENPECKRVFTLKESLWFCFISLTPQGGGDAPKCISGRLVAAIWWLFGFIFVASYTANLAAFLTVSRLENRVDTMDGLSKQYKIRYAPIENSAADAYFIKMAYIEDKYYDIWKNLSLDDSISEDERANLAVWEYPVSDKYTKIKAQIIEAGQPSSLEDGFRRVRESPNSNEGFAMITTSLDVDYLSYLNCDVYKAGEDFAYHPMAFPISKESPHNLKQLIDPVIRELKANGFITSLRIKYWDKNPNRKSCPDWRKLSNGLVLTDTWGIFLVILSGLIATLIVISLENYIIILMRKAKSTKEGRQLIKKAY